MRVGIALGANLGDKLMTLNRAVDYLRTMDNHLVLSSWYSSRPLDCPANSPDFINGVLEMGYQGDLYDLLNELQALEIEAGRAEIRDRNAPRPLDLDILYADNQIINSERLTLPHPRAAERLFVLQPLSEIVPDRVLPGGDESISKLCEILKEQNKEMVCQKLKS
ncbi:MAG: 2-amino-4-hydroxy-6-hydroxymethyldihydropteridine diphosphokinase [Verrucomicrobiota bacterium]